MRLGQLSRKLNISPAEIGAIIADEFKVTIGEHPNIKMDDEHAKFIIEKFQDPDSEKFDPIPVTEDKNDLEKAHPQNKKGDNEYPENNPIRVQSDSLEKEEIETIRVEASKLEGLTVVDKIELPEPPPPEMVEIDGVMYDKAELKKQRIAERKEREAKKRKEATRRAVERKLLKNKSENKNKKELSFAEKRSIEEKLESDRKRQDDRHKRYRQKKHYESKHKIHKDAGISPKKKQEDEDEVEVDVEDIIIETRSEPKTMLGKFWRWLNTY